MWVLLKLPRYNSEEPNVQVITTHRLMSPFGPGADISAEADSAGGAVYLPLFRNALQGVGAEIVELDSRACN